MAAFVRPNARQVALRWRESPRRVRLTKASRTHLPMVYRIEEGKSLAKLRIHGGTFRLLVAYYLGICDYQIIKEGFLGLPAWVGNNWILFRFC